MAFDPSPTGYFPNINVTGVIAGVTGVFIPYDDLESFDYTVATSESGDIRQFMYSVIEGYADRHFALSSTNRPSQITLSRTSTVPSDDVVRKVYSFTINVALGPTEVTPE